MTRPSCYSLACSSPIPPTIIFMFTFLMFTPYLLSPFFTFALFAFAVFHFRSFCFRLFDVALIVFALMLSPLWGDTPLVSYDYSLHYVHWYLLISRWTNLRLLKHKNLRNFTYIFECYVIYEYMHRKMACILSN